MDAEIQEIQEELAKILQFIHSLEDRVYETHKAVSELADELRATSSEVYATFSLLKEHMNNNGEIPYSVAD